jgi:hypothetical protein
VTPIAVSGTERGSGQNWAQTVGYRHSEDGRNTCITKNNSKINAKVMVIKKLPETSVVKGGSKTLWFENILVVLDSIII